MLVSLSKTTDEKNMKKSKLLAFKEFLVITFATFIVSLGIYLFKFPNHFSTGGVAGLAVVIPRLIQISQGHVTLLLNLLFLLLGFIFFGKSFGIKTTYSSLLLSAFILLLEKYYPINTPLTDQPILELIFAILLPAIGSAILFNNDASTGGTDVLAKIIKKFTKGDIGNALLYSDFLIASSTFLVFNVKVGLFSLIGLLLKSIIVDNVITNINTVKYFTIITNNEKLVGEYIKNNLHGGLTEFSGNGGYTNNNRKIIITCLNKKNAILLKEFISKNDPNAFIMITNTSQIIGKGFKTDI